MVKKIMNDPKNIVDEMLARFCVCTQRTSMV